MTTRHQITPDDDYGPENWPYVANWREDDARLRDCAKGVKPMSAAGAVSFFLLVLLVGLWLIPWAAEHVAEWIA